MVWPSLTELIARREWYSGRVVRARGVLADQFEDRTLYPSHDAYENYDAPSAVWLMMTAEQTQEYSTLDGQWVYVEGSYEVPPQGPSAGFGGRIRVSRIWAGGTPRSQRSGPRG